jgi:hypothetical protein
MDWKRPPTIKFYEALGAIADDRVTVTSPGTAMVLSSSGGKTYTVLFDPDGWTIAANDNGSYWQGYLGYPAIAYLVKQGLLPLDSEIVTWLVQIPWKDLNTEHKDYPAVMSLVHETVRQRGGDVARLQGAVTELSAALDALALKRPSGPRPRPPVGY